jgi:hypothetical protein
VPTSLRRHVIVETPAVQRALDELRRELDTDRIDLGELVVLGVAAKVADLRAERENAALRRDLANRVRSGDVLVDRAAADEVRAAGWARDRSSPET